jgi:serine/threonine-protein kinase
MSADSEVVSRAEQRVGTILRGKYRLDRVLGVGGMAVVYAATHRNQKQFAVKLLLPELSIREDIRARFLREGYAANSVKHPGAVAVLDDDLAEDGAAFLVMELLEGAPVETLWESCGSRLPLAATLFIGHQLLDVLAAAHAKGIVHRDIKPANLFVTHEGVVKVLDFGIARVRDLAATGVQATGTGILLGTPAFMAPEQALGRPNEIDAQTDLWAVGATLFTLLSGRSVHEGETGTQVLILAATTPAQSLASIAPGVPAPVIGIVDRALAFQRGARWPSAEVMREAIAQAQVAVFGRRLSAEAVTSLSRGLERTFARTQHENVAMHSSHPPVAATVDTQSRSVAPTVGPGPGASAAGQASWAPPQQPAWVSHPSASPWTAPPQVPPAARPSQAPPPWSPPGTGLVGGTTAQPVYAEEPLAPAGLPSRRPLIFVLAFAGAALVAGAIAFGVSARGGAPPASSAEDSPARSGSMGPQTPSEDADAAASPLDASPSPHALASVAPSSVTAPAASTGSAAATSTAQRTVPSPAAAPAVNCRPPFYFDAAGNKVFKKECL